MEVVETVEAASIAVPTWQSADTARRGVHRNGDDAQPLCITQTHARGCPSTLFTVALAATKYKT